MYKSPIEILHAQAMCQLENDIYKAVMRYNINVDKEELLKALKYDRDQYDRGYEDGKNEYNGTWIPCSERLPEVEGSYMTTTEYGAVRVNHFYTRSNTWGYKSNKTIAWMPLPLPYREEKKDGV